MLLLRILSGASAGREIPASRFPFRIGRKAPADLVLAEPGIWDPHAEIQLSGDRSFVLKALQEADVEVGGAHGRALPIRNGDRIQLGNVSVALFLAPPRSGAGNQILEWTLWAGWALLFAFQFWLIYSIL